MKTEYTVRWWQDDIRELRVVEEEKEVPFRFLLLYQTFSCLDISCSCSELMELESKFVLWAQVLVGDGGHLCKSTLMSLTRLCSAHGHCLWQDSQPHPIMLPEFWRHHYHCTTKWLIAHGIKYRINLGIQPTCCWEWIGTMCLYHGNLALTVSDSWRPQYWRCVKNGSKFVSWIGGEPL